MHLSHNTGLDCIALDNDRLEILYCDSSELKSMNVKQAPALRKLHLTGNQLESLNLAPMSGLKELLCAHNRLTELPVYQHLCALDCSYNRLKSLDLSEYMMVLDPSDEYRKDTVYVVCRYSTRDEAEYEKPDSFFWGKEPGGSVAPFFHLTHWNYRFYFYNEDIIYNFNRFYGNSMKTFLPNSSTSFNRCYIAPMAGELDGVHNYDPYYLIWTGADVPYPYLDFKYQETPATLYIPERSRCGDYPYSCVYYWRTLFSSHKEWYLLEYKGSKYGYEYNGLCFELQEPINYQVYDLNRVEFAK